MIRLFFIAMVISASLTAFSQTARIAIKAGKADKVIRAVFNSEEFGKLTTTWAQTAIGVLETHAFLNTARVNKIPTIGIVDAGFTFEDIFYSTRISNNLTNYLRSSIKPSSIADIDVSDEQFGDRVDTMVIEALLEKMGMDEKDRRYITSHFLKANFYERERWKEHGTAVATLIAGQLPFGVSARGEIDFLSAFTATGFLEFILMDAQDRKDSEDRYRHFFDQLADQKDLPDIINISARLPSTEKIRELAKRTLVVTSADNNFPSPMGEIKRKLSGEIVVVGSSDPAGYVSSFSPSGDKVTVCAPSDNCLRTIGIGRDLISFGHTSGAAPQVTGALADVLSFLPTLTASEAVHMLRKTAIMGVGESAVPNLNYYKLVRVAAKLADIGWPEQREMIFDDQLYDFTAEAQQLLTSIDDTALVEEFFTNLRVAFFLDPNNYVVRELLAEIYNQAGLETQALFYSNNPVPNRYTTTYDFLTAVVEVDIERLRGMFRMLPSLRKEKLLEDYLIEVMREMDAEDRRTLIDFFRKEGVVFVDVF